MSVREEVLALQEAEAVKEGITDAVMAQTKALYAGIDALTPEQRTLAVEVFLRHAVGSLNSVTDQTSMAGAFVTVPGLLALAGYANAVHRETDLGATATGDKTVDALLERFHTMLRDHALEQMSPETRARLDSGEDPNVVAEEIRQRLIADGVNPETGGPVETKADEDTGYGLYL